jgi:hypothetical protein
MEYGFFGLVIALAFFGILFKMGFFSGTKPGTQAPPAGQQAQQTQPAPAPTVDSGGVSFKKLWLPVLLIGGLLILGWWALKDSTPTHKAGPAPQARQQQPQPPKKFHIEIDPLSFNESKSQGVRVEKNSGFTSIVVPPDTELVYEFHIRDKLCPSGYASIDYHLWQILPQYAGYRINNIRHNEEYAFGSGLTRLGPELREFKEGKNEFALFTKGELRINGDEKIVIYQR